MDFGWEYLESVQSHIKRLVDEENSETSNSKYEFSELKTFLATWDEAQKAAKSVNWEGDFRSEPCVFFMPNEYEISVGFVWKQENNGDTLVVSPLSLPWLKQ